METRNPKIGSEYSGRTLETSLVEWKQVDGQVPGQVGAALGNFLSGMETPFPM